MRALLSGITLALLAMSSHFGGPVAFPGENASSPAAVSAESAFYVSPLGNDRWSGRLPDPNAKGTDGPFATLARARDAVRQSKSRGGATVYLRGGYYEISEPIVFQAEDSGSQGAPVTYAANPSDSQPPILSGGRILTGWREQSGLWVLQVPEIREGKWFPRQLFVDGARRHRASSPVSGFATTEGEISNGEQAEIHGSASLSSDDVQDGAEALALDKWLDFRAMVVRADGGSVTLSRRRHALMNQPNIRYRFENVRSGLSSEGSWFVSRREGAIYYHPMPGESPGRITAIASYLPQVIRLEGSAGSIHDIAFKGLTVAYTDWTMPGPDNPNHQSDADLPAAIEIRGGHSIVFDHCTFKGLGFFAIDFNHGSKSNRIENNEMVDLGAGAIKIGEPNGDVHPKNPGGGNNRGGGNRGGLGGPGFGRRGGFGQRPQQGGGGGQERQGSMDPNDYRYGPDYPRSDEETCSGNIISGNRIHDVGLVFAGAGAIWIGQSYGNTISHNDIFDTYHSPINVGWSWGYVGSAAHHNIIEYNLIYNIGRGLMSDVGGVYILGQQPGTVIRNNVIHDVTAYAGPSGYGGWGIYLDGGTNEVLVENNLVYRTKGGAFRQSQGQNNTFTNNIFAFGEELQMRRQRGAPQLSLTFERNIVYWDSGPLFGTPIDEGTYQFNYNLYYCTSGNIEITGPRGQNLSYSEWQARGEDRDSIVADPMFVNPQSGDFRLRPGSPASKIGFRPFDYSRAGAGR